MEYALFLDDIKKYKGKNIQEYTIDFGEKNIEIETVNQKLKEIGDADIEYLYYGSEFCENLLPDWDSILEILKLCDKEKLELVFVTPMVSDFGIKKIDILIDRILSFRKQISVVVNDYGVLELIKSKCNDNIKCIAGRVLDKTSHDSRADSRSIEDYYGKNGIRFAKTPGIISKASMRVLGKYGIDRFEFDMPKTGLDFGDEVINCSVYWPFNYITTGRICLFKMLFNYQQDKFLVDSCCQRECKEYYLQLRKPLNGFYVENCSKITDTFMYQKGNTIYYIIPYINDVITSQFNRIIIQIL